MKARRRPIEPRFLGGVSDQRGTAMDGLRSPCRRESWGTPVPLPWAAGRSGPQPRHGAHLAERMPERRRLLDQTLGAAERLGHGQRQPAAQRDRTEIVVERQFNIRPIALVGLIADGEVEAIEAAIDSMPQ